MEVHAFEITLGVTGPFLTQSSSVGKYGVDAPIARTDGRTAVYIPFSLLKGKLLQAWDELGLTAMRGRLGEECGNAEKDGPVEAKSASIQFEDLVQVEGTAPIALRHRIKIDDERGSVKEGALLVMESPFAAGELVKFRGRARFFGPGTEKADVKEGLECGLRWTGSLGAERTNGFGRIASVLVTDVAAPADTSALIDPVQLQFALRPKSPFCLALQRKSGNLFESNREIPGGAIKGALARQLAADGRTMDAKGGKLGEHFDKVRFTHALPSADGSKIRPSRPPLSLVKLEKGEFFDVVSRGEPCLINKRAPEFDIDWKSRDGLDAKFGWPDEHKELRVRTAIQAATLRAKDEKLFAYELVDPKGLEWLGSIDLSRVPEADRKAVAAELGSKLAGGLTSLGKTKAAAAVKGAAFGPKFASRPAPVNGEWRISLTTPALLCDPGAVTRATGNADQLFEAYRKRWSDLSDRKLTLKHFFARQSLAGGYFLWKRFQGGGTYQPWLLTDAGSVFVLTGDEGQPCIDDWLKHGLPVHGETWQTCPFLPENGYGEIAVNLELPAEFALPAEATDAK